MKTLFAAIRFWRFKRFFRKVTGKNLNIEQEKMYSLAEKGGKQESYGRNAGTSTFIVVYAQFLKKNNTSVVVVGSKYLREVAEKLIPKREYPIIAHNSDYAGTLVYKVLIIDQADSLSPKFREKVLDPLLKSGIKVIEIDAN